VIKIEEDDEIVNDEQLEAIAVSTITEYESDSELINELNILKNRCEQFNDVKQTISSMNDLIKEEVDSNCFLINYFFYNFNQKNKLIRYSMILAQS